MRIPLITILMLVSGLPPVDADGVLVMKQRPNPDPKSHAHDITEPAQKALIIYNKGIEHLILQVSFKGDASDFAWLVPTPSRPEVSKVEEPVFHLLHNDTAPKIRYWFDADQKIGSFQGRKMTSAGSASPSPDVRVLEEKQVGVYDIAVLRAGDAGDLLQWLKGNGYQITPRLMPVASDYIRRGWVFTAMRINTGYQGRVGQRLREGVLQSLRFKFRAPEPVYPLKISSLNSGKIDLLLYVLAAHRVNEPLLTTECSLEHYLPYFLFGFDDILRLDMKWRSTRLTKLTARLAPEQMTHDLLLKPARSDDVMPVKDISPPLLDNLGATSLLFMGCMLTYPVSLIVLGFAGLAALSPFGRKRWRVLIAVGIIFVMVGIITGNGMLLVLPIASYCKRSGGYSSVGIASLVLAGIVIIGATASNIMGWNKKPY